MKKISLSNQIVILFIIIILTAGTAFTLLTLTRLKNLAETETYSRLIAYSRILNSQSPNGDIIDFRDMELAFIKVSNNHVTAASPDLTLYINDDDLNYILQVIESDRSKTLYTEKMVNYNNDTIYYVITVSETKDLSIIITNSNYVLHITRSVSLELICVFMAIVCLSILVIAGWSSNMAKRLHRIQDHVLELPKSSYQTAYRDDGLDEIGELSRAVEKMRIEIKENEKTKQEMLQNISHDFKTPIAVIKSYAEAQEDGMADDDSSKIIIAQADILKHKVNKLLQYNSLKYLEKDREFEDVDMKEVVEEVIRGYKFQTNLEIELDLAEDIYFKGYRENYYTVVDNIIDNARRYAKSKIKVVLRKERLRIYNDGEPIDEQFVKNSFKPYEKGSKGEFGLGMSIVKKTVEFFGMELIAKNEPIGVSFIITKK